VSRFADSIDRLFEELIYEAWGGARRRRPAQPADAVLDLQLPFAGADCGDLSFVVEGHTLIVSGRQRIREPEGGTAVRRTTTREFEHRIALPLGTEPAAIEARFDADALRLRIQLRTSSRSEEA
jgi:HSP20 family molecular chaperone IbpA